ncbi:MAG: hypothetical protein MUE52_13040 [Tabrizicola sp.]|nr:hypothetical protein [Tabrizicola sp.]
MTVIVVTLPQTASRNADRLLRHEATEFAFSKVEEYRVTFPQLQAQGTEPSGWSWTIAERTLPEAGSIAPIEFVEIEVTAWHASRPDLSSTLTAIVARRSQG